jgi:hypothetical protein
MRQSMDTESVREDLGYMNGQVIPMDRSRFVMKKRIRYIACIMKDQEQNVAVAFADEKIAEGMAVEVEARQPGQEG